MNKCALAATADVTTPLVTSRPFQGDLFSGVRFLTRPSTRAEDSKTSFDEWSKKLIRNRIYNNGEKYLLGLKGNPPLMYRNEDTYRSGLGMRGGKGYEAIGQGYRDLFCRRCCRYDCPLHIMPDGGFPLPKVRVDPPRIHIDTCKWNMGRPD